MSIRRIISLCLCLLLCASGQASRRYAVQVGDAAWVVDAEGRAVLGGEGLMAFEVRPDALYAAGVPGSLALYDAEGAALGEARFDMIDDAGIALIFRQGDRYGALGDRGAVVIEPQWTQLTRAGDGYLALTTSVWDEQPDEIFRLTLEGAAASTGVFTGSGLEPMSEGRMAWRDAEGLWGYLDEAGQPAIANRWRWAGPFEGGRALVSGGEGYGLIDVDGREVLAPVYRWLERRGATLAGLRADGEAQIISPLDGAVLWRCGDEGLELSLAGEYVAVRSAEGCRLLSGAGEVLMTAPANAHFSPGDAGQVIMADGPWGEPCQRIVRTDGTPVSGSCQRLVFLRPGLYEVFAFEGDHENVRCGLLDSSGKELLPPRYRDIAPAGDDRLLLVDDDGARLWALNGEAVSISP